MDEEELERLAAEELLKEAKQGAARAVVHGALGWKKDNAPRPNKRFLTTTLANTMQHNYRRSRSRSSSPRHKYKHRPKERSPSHESSHRDQRHHRSREEGHSNKRKHDSDRSSRRERSDVGHSSKKYLKDERKDERKHDKSKRSRSN